MNCHHENVNRSSKSHKNAISYFANWVLHIFVFTMSRVELVRLNPCSRTGGDKSRDMFDVPVRVCQELSSVSNQTCRPSWAWTRLCICLLYPCLVYVTPSLAQTLNYLLYFVTYTQFKYSGIHTYLQSAGYSYTDRFLMLMNIYWKKTNCLLKEQNPWKNLCNLCVP